MAQVRNDDEEGDRGFRGMLGRTAFLAVLACVVLAVCGLATANRRPSSGSDVKLTFLMSEYDMFDADGRPNHKNEQLTFLAQNPASRPVFLAFTGVETNGPSGWVPDRQAHLAEVMQPMHNVTPGDCRLLSFRIATRRPRPDIARRVCVSVWKPPSRGRQLQRAARRLVANLRAGAFRKSFWPMAYPEPALECTVEMDPALARYATTDAPGAGSLSNFEKAELVTSYASSQDLSEGMRDGEVHAPFGRYLLAKQAGSILGLKLEQYLPSKSPGLRAARYSWVLFDGDQVRGKGALEAGTGQDPFHDLVTLEGFALEWSPGDWIRLPDPVLLMRTDAAEVEELFDLANSGDWLSQQDRKRIEDAKKERVDKLRLALGVE